MDCPPKTKVDTSHEKMQLQTPHTTVYKPTPATPRVCVFTQSYTESFFERFCLFKAWLPLQNCITYHVKKHPSDIIKNSCCQTHRFRASFYRYGTPAPPEPKPVTYPGLPFVLAYWPAQRKLHFTISGALGPLSKVSTLSIYLSGEMLSIPRVAWKTAEADRPPHPRGFFVVCLCSCFGNEPGFGTPAREAFQTHTLRQDLAFAHGGGPQSQLTQSIASDVTLKPVCDRQACAI